MADKFEFVEIDETESSPTEGWTKKDYSGKKVEKFEFTSLEEEKAKADALKQDVDTQFLGEKKPEPEVFEFEEVDDTPVVEESKAPLKLSRPDGKDPFVESIMDGIVSPPELDGVPPSRSIGPRKTDPTAELMKTLNMESGIPRPDFSTADLADLPDESYLETREYAKEKLGMMDKFNELGDDPTQVLPFISSAVGMSTFAEIIAASDRLKAGKSTELDDALLTRFIDKSRAKKSFMYNVTDIVTSLPAFATEFAATSGIYGLGTQTTKKLGKEAIEYLFGEGAEKLVKHKGAQFAGKIGAGIAGATLQSPFAGVARIPEDAFRRAIPDIIEREDGTLGVAGEKKSLGMAFAEANTANWAEIVSERGGAVFGAAAGLIPEKGVTRSIVNAIKKFNPKIKNKTINDVFEKTAFHGTWGEVFEERLVGGINVLTGIEEFKVPDPKELAVQIATELVAFSVPGAAGRAIDYLATSPAEVEAEETETPETVAQAAEAQLDELEAKAKEAPVTPVAKPDVNLQVDTAEKTPEKQEVQPTVKEEVKKPVKVVPKKQEETGLKSDVMDFIDKRVASLGNMEDVQETYKTDSTIDLYARSKAKELFGAEDKQETPPKTPEPASVAPKKPEEVKVVKEDKKEAPVEKKPEVKTPVEKITVTDKSVRDHPQQAIINKDSIKINLKVGRKTTGSYDIPLSEWEATEKGPSANPNWNKSELIKKYTKPLGLDEQPGGPEQADRIRDSHVRAIEKAYKKYRSFVIPEKKKPGSIDVITSPGAEFDDYVNGLSDEDASLVQEQIDKMRLESKDRKKGSVKVLSDFLDSKKKIEANKEPIVNVIKNPAGRFSFVGRVDFRLSYINKDGSYPTDKQIEVSRQSGPGFANPKLIARSWDTKEEALQAKADLEKADKDFTDDHILVVKPDATPEMPAIKEPWEMTREEFDEFHTEHKRGYSGVAWDGEAVSKWFDEYDRLTGNQSGKDILADAKKYGGASQARHRRIIENAAKENKPVPDAVLAEYPDLAKQADSDNDIQVNHYVEYTPDEEMADPVKGHVTELLNDGAGLLIMKPDGDTARVWLDKGKISNHKKSSKDEAIAYYDGIANKKLHYKSIVHVVADDASQIRPIDVDRLLNEAKEQFKNDTEYNEFVEYLRSQQLSERTRQVLNQETVDKKEKTGYITPKKEGKDARTKTQRDQGGTGTEGDAGKHVYDNRRDPEGGGTSSSGVGVSATKGTDYERSDETIHGIESATRNDLSTSGVSSDPIEVGGQQAPYGDGRDISGAESVGVVSETVRPDDNASRPSLAQNYDLRDKEPVVLTKGNRAKANASAKEIIKLNPDPAKLTDEQKDALRQYTGEGGLSSGTREALNQHFTDYSTIKGMYNALDKSGFKYRKALEPAGGAGSFVGMKPNLDWSIVDIDKTNSQVTSLLYPNANNYNVSYESFVDTGYDLVISNVPFLEMRGESGMSVRPDIKALHDYYFVHALDNVREDGVVAFITSTGVMDKLNGKIREEIVSKADIIGAYRLPQGHFTKTAHTDVTVDIIFMQKRPVGQKSRMQETNDAFVESVKDDKGLKLNSYYKKNPDNILGDLVVGKNKMYGGREEYVVEGKKPDLSKMKIDYKAYSDAGRDNKAKDIADIPTNSKEFSKWAADQDEFYIRQTFPSMYMQELPNITVDDDGDTVVLEHIVNFTDITGKAKLYKKLTGDLGDKVSDLKEINDLADRFQASGNPDYSAVAIERIEAYKKEYKKHPSTDKKLRGLFNKHGEMTTFAELTSNILPDFTAPEVLKTKVRYTDSGKLEITAKSPLRERLFSNEDNKGIVDISKAQYLDVSEIPEILANDYSLVDYTGDNAVVQNNILYYSGNIYDKLDDAESLQKKLDKSHNKDDFYNMSVENIKRQITELKAILPEAKKISEIRFKGSEAWLFPYIEKAYDNSRNYALRITKEKNNKSGLVAFSYPNKIYTKYLNNMQLASRYRDPDTGELEPVSQYMGKVRAAEEKVNEIRNRILREFKLETELFIEAERAYNRKFNGYVEPHYEKAEYLIQDVLDEIEKGGSGIKLRKNQKKWILKAVYEGKGINAHDVGAGKTMSAIALGRVLKKRGIAKKPLYAVPAKTIKKWARETRMLFPDAKIIDLGKLAKNKKGEALFNLANSNADFVFISHEGFKSLELPAEAERQYVEEIIAEHLDFNYAQDQKAKGREYGKLLEKIQKFRRAMSQIQRNEKITLDKLGIDAIIADEAHAFKNIGINAELVKFGLGGSFSINAPENKIPTISPERAYDFRFKANYIIDNNNDKNVYLLTATPTQNKPMEIYTMLRHLSRNVFSEYGIDSDRDFANTFFGLNTVKVPGTQKTKSILGEIVNANDLKAILNRYVDKVSIDEMPWIEVPKQVEHQHFLEQSDQYAEIAADLSDRASSLDPRPQKGDDTIIAIYTGGRTGSIDPRLYGGEHANVNVDSRSFSQVDDKIEFAIENVVNNLEKNPEGAQLVFLDNAGHTQVDRGDLTENIHVEMKKDIIKRLGLKPHQVAIINGKNITNIKTGKETGIGTTGDQKKQDIADAYNAGDVKVVIGTTQSMGEGMDLQVKTTDIWHLDIPWKPGEYHQRNGRGVRYGNENDSVNIHYIFMQGTYDSISYQVVAHKKGWNQAIWDKSSEDVISTKEEMTSGVIPKREQILLSMEPNPVNRRKLEVGFMQNRLWDEKSDLNNMKWTLQTRIRENDYMVPYLERRVSERQYKYDNLVPDEKIKNKKDRAAAFDKLKAYYANLIDTSKRHIEEENEKKARNQKTLADDQARIDEIDREVEAIDSRYTDEAGNIIVPEKEAAALLDNVNIPIDGIVKDVMNGIEPDIPTVNQSFIEGEQGFLLLPPIGPKKDVKKFKFSDVEAEEGFQESKGVRDKTFSKKIKDSFEYLKNITTREFEHLPKTKRYAQLRFDILRLQKQKGVANDKAVRYLNKITDELNDYEFDLFSRKVLLDDLVETSKEGKALPGWVTAESLPGFMAEVDMAIGGNIKIADALAERNRFWDSLRKDYIYNMKIIGLDVSKRFERVNYFRHQVLEYAQIKSIVGTGQRLKTPAYKGWLKERHGSTLNINTDYIEAEYEVMAGMIYDIEVAKTISGVNRNYNIQDKLKAEATILNDVNIMPFFDKLAEEESSFEGEFDGEAMMRKMLKWKQAVGFEALQKLASEDGLPIGNEGQFEELVEALADSYETEEAIPEWAFKDLFRYMSYILEQGANPEAMNATGMIFRGIREKREFIKKELGDEFMTWDKLVPDGYTLWQPREGTVFYMANSIPERLAEELTTNKLAKLNISKDMITKVLANGGKRRSYVIPVEVAETLNNMLKAPPTSAVSKIHRMVLVRWKEWQLMSPRRIFKYNARNLTGDADHLFAGNPSAFRKVPRALKELYDAYRSGDILTGDIADWFERGGTISTFQAQELSELKNLSIMAHAHSSNKESFPRMAWNKYWRTARLTTDFRESILRYAAYLDYLEQIKNNDGRRPNNYGASIQQEIDGLADPRDKAFWLSNDLLGAYDRVSVLGQTLRTHLIPFWSWKEVNFTIYKRLFQNAVMDDRLTSAVGRQILGKGVIAPPRMVISVGKFVVMATAFTTMIELYNNLFFGDDEDELPAYVRDRPHINLGRGADGKPRYFNRIGALGDLLEWFNIDAFPFYVREFQHNRMTIKEIALDMVKAPANIMIQGVEPFFKTGVELLTRRALFPDAFRPKAIRDRMLHVAMSIGVENEYKALAGLPSRGYKRSLGKLVYYDVDPYEAAYNELYGDIQRFKRKLGKGGQGFWLNNKSNALYNARLALRYDDVKAFNKYVSLYVNLGGTANGLEASLNAMHPFHGMSGAEQAVFAAYIGDGKKKRNAMALKFYEDLMALGDNDPMVGAVKKKIDAPKKGKTLSDGKSPYSLKPGKSPFTLEPGSRNRR